IKNCIHVFACSNTKRALYLSDVDRRWFLPLVTEKLLDEKYWINFHRWVQEDGLGVILHYLKELAKDPANIIGTGEHAPSSATKDEVIEESRSPGEQIAHSLGRFAVEEKFKIVLALDDAHRFTAGKLGYLDVNDPRMAKPQAIKQAMLRAGMKEPGVTLGKQRKRYKVDLGDKFGTNFHFTYIVANFEVAEDAPW